MGARTFSFLHAADLHLDSPLRDLTLYPGAPSAEMRGATGRAFKNLVELALDRRVQFVVIAGDLFDGNLANYNSCLSFTYEVRQLVRAGIPVYLLRGNHDAASVATRKLTLPEGAFEFDTTAPVTLRVEGLDVALHGQGFEHRDEMRNLALAYPAPVPGCFNLGVLHTALTGYEGHDSYAPCTLGDLVAKGYDYWALGHIHQREIVAKEPWVVFPGNLQGRHVRELGPKGATLVTVEEGQVVDVTFHACDVARWAHVEVALEDVALEVDLLARVREQLIQVVAEAEGRLVAARVTLRGETPLDGPLRRQRARIEGEVRNLAASVDAGFWIEKVRIETRTPGRPTSQDPGFPALIERIQSASFNDDEAAVFAGELARFAQRLPPRVAAALGPNDPAALQALAPEAARYLAALLAGEVSSKDDHDDHDGVDARHGGEPE